MVYEELAEELRLLVAAKEWKMVRTWFSYWDSEKELISKVLLWGRFFLPNYFRDTTPEFHKELIRENFSKENEYTAAPRGFAKTTINQLCIWFQVVNRMEQFIVVIEKSFNEASEVIRGVVDQFKDNDMIKQVYGNLVKVSASGEYEEKNKDAQGDVIINGVRLRAKGFNTPIRGLKSNEWRPTKIYVDDVESDEHIQNEEQRRKYRENYTQGIVPAVDITGSIKVRGTILHNDSLLKNLIDQFNGKIYRAFDKRNPEETLLWSERWGYQQLMKKKAEMEMEGKGTSKFYQEFLNEPVDDEFRTFRWDWLNQTFTDESLKGKAISRTITIDVADSKKDGADFTGVTIVDWDSENNWYIQFVKRYRINTKELVDLIINLWEFWKPVKIGVEKSAFEDQVTPWLKVVSQEKGVFPVVVALQHGGRQKEDRIRGALVGRFQAKKIWFNRNNDNTGELKSELYDFPHAKNDDLGDSLAFHEQIGFRPMGLKKEVPTTIDQLFYSNRKQPISSNLASRLANL